MSFFTQGGHVITGLPGATPMKPGSAVSKSHLSQVVFYIRVWLSARRNFTGGHNCLKIIICCSFYRFCGCKSIYGVVHCHSTLWLLRGYYYQGVFGLSRSLLCSHFFSVANKEMLTTKPADIRKLSYTV